MICPACQTAADRGWGREHHCLLDSSQCTCQHRPREVYDTVIPEG